MFRSQLLRWTTTVRGDLRRTFAVQAERLRSAKFVDVKQALSQCSDLKERPFRLRGWINSTVKSKKNVCFFHLNDGLSNEIIQVVLSKELENSLKHNLVYGTSVICTGQLVESKGKGQAVEFKASQVEFAGQTELFPFHNKEHSDDWDNIRQHLPLRFKSRHFASLQRLRGKLLVHTHEYLQANGYLNVTTPIITMNDCEGGGEAFQVLSSAVLSPLNDEQTNSSDQSKSPDQMNSPDQMKSDKLNASQQPNSEPPNCQSADSSATDSSATDSSAGSDAESTVTTDTVATRVEGNETFFGKPTYLTVSGQLHLEAASLGANRVYTLSPCFRSENSVSRKHLCEFLMLELEESYLDSLDVLMDRVERLCKDLAGYLISECKEEIDLILSKNDKSHLDAIISHDYKRITYEDAIRLVNEQSELPKLDYGANFNTTYETFLTNHFGQTPVFISHFPAYIKPFYMKTRHDKALNFDLIFPVCGEVAGGSLREDDSERMDKLFEVHNLKDLEWYKTLRKEGSLPHGGFGLGIDRFVQAILAMQNIRDVVPFPRWVHHCKC